MTASLIKWMVRVLAPVLMLVPLCAGKASAAQPPVLPKMTSCTALQFTPDGKYLVAAVEDGSLAAFELARKKWVKFQTDKLETRQRYLGNCIACYPDSETVVSAGPETPIRFWNLRTGKLIGSVPTCNGKGAYSLSLSADGRLLLSGEEDLVLRDGATAKELKRFFHTGWRACVLSADGRLFLTPGGDQSDSCFAAVLWDVTNGKSLREFPGTNGANIWQMGFSQNGSLALRAESDGFSILDCRSGKVVRSISMYIPPSYPGEMRYGTCVSACFSPTGRYVLSGSRNQEPRLWEVATGKVALLLKQEGRLSMLMGNQFAISPDGRIAASAGCHHDPLVLWDLRSGAPIWITTEWIGSGR